MRWPLLQRLYRVHNLSDRGKVLCRKLNSLAVDQEEHILESYGDKTSELKRLLESLIDSSN